MPREVAMASARTEIFQELMPPAQAEAMIALCERFGSYGSYAEDATNAVALAPDVPQRYDAAANFVRTGGRLGRREDPKVLAARTNYFRETYAYDEPVAPGIEPFLRHDGFLEAARKIHDRPIVVPNIVYANLLVPGQELAVHTDVPEFRGANRKRFPQWLMVVMHHSRLFEAWRIPIATGIAYFQECEGGALAYYPHGPEGPVETLPARHNTAIVLDTDSVFHGVDRVAETVPLPALRPGMRLRFEGEGRFAVGPEAAPLAHYRWGELRFSVSWKAYCFADEAERRAVLEHADDLELDAILGALEGDLRRRGRIGSRTPEGLPAAAAGWGGGGRGGTP
jgi:hypothetical protein